MTIEMNGETYLTTSEVLALIGVRRETLSKYIKKGLIKPYKRGFERTSYFKQSAVTALNEMQNTIVPREQE